MKTAMHVDAGEAPAVIDDGECVAARALGEVVGGFYYVWRGGIGATRVPVAMMRPERS